MVENSKFNLFIDESFIRNWPFVDSSWEFFFPSFEVRKINKNLKNDDYELGDVLLTTSSKLLFFKEFKGYIFYLLDELIDGSHDYDQKKMTKIPKGITLAEVSLLWNKQIEKWHKKILLKQEESLAYNVQHLIKYYRSQMKPVKEKDYHEYKKVISFCEEGSFINGPMAIKGGKLFLTPVSQVKLMKKKIEPWDFLIHQESGLYYIFSFHMQNKNWIFQNTEVTIWLLEKIRSWLQKKGFWFYKRDFTRELLNHLPFPVVVREGNQKNIFSNSKFFKLGLSEKELKLIKQSYLKLGQKNYRIKKKNFHIKKQKYEAWYFFEQSHEKDINFYSDLGIICSSLAHELKNPLAGILAAINVLEISDDLDKDDQDLQKMKETTLRAKRLVETFLGFSKMNLPLEDGILKIGDKKGDQVNAQRAFNQARDLLKERIVESQIEVCFDYYKVKKIQLKMNEAVITMIFYLIFNEALTRFIHGRLIGRQNQALRIKIEERKDRLIIESEPRFEQSDNDKLVQYLISMQSLMFSCEAEKFIIKKA